MSLCSDFVAHQKGLNRSALIAGLAVTAIVLLLERTGTLSGVEGALLDARFAYARLAPAPLDDGMALVAIDDSSIQHLGRWPWPRPVQAAGIDEIRRAGAKVVAFDILFDGPSFDPADDEVLAASIERCHGIVGANSDPSDFVAKEWRDLDADTPLARMLRVLGTALMLSDEEVAQSAALDEKWAARLSEQPLRLRELAAWLRLRALIRDGKEPTALSEFEAAVGVDLGVDDSPIRRMLARLWTRHEAWMALSRWMPATSGEASPNETPPILPVARAAGGVGMVYGPADADGQTRRVRPLLVTPGGGCLQLGLAAAAAYLDVQPSSVQVGDEAVMIGTHRVPLHDGAVMINWPTAMFEGKQTLRGGGPRRPTIPFSTLVSLASARQVQAEQEERWLKVTEKVAARLSKPLDQMRQLPVSPALRAELQENIGFMMPGVLERGFDALPPDATNDEKDDASQFIAWAKLVDQLPRGREALERTSRTVRDALEGRLVFIGFIATAIAADMINTPYGTRTPGVYVHAAVASMALSGSHLHFAPAITEPTATLLLGALCAVAAAGLTAARGAIAVLVALLLYGGAAWFSFALASFVVPMAGPLIGGFGSWVAGVTFVAVISQRERVKIIRQFRARVSSELVERLTGDPDALSVGGVEREITVLFGDLAGFTTLSEQLGGPQVVITLNRYMGALTRSLTARRAYVNKFLGDGLLAFWSAFGIEPDQCRLSIEAARVCQDEVAALGETPEFRDRPRIRLRLGIATGKAVVGDCGAPPELNDYTAIGDVVNLASRLESANKQFGTNVLLDGKTAAASGAAASELVGLGRVVVVGQSVPVEVFTLLDGAMTIEMRSAIEAAVTAFASGDRERARSAWSIAAERGASSIAKPFLSAIENEQELLDGVLRLRAK